MARRPGTPESGLEDRSARDGMKRYDLKVCRDEVVAGQSQGITFVSVADGKALPGVPWALQFVDHGNGKIGEADAAASVRPYQ